MEKIAYLGLDVHVRHSVLGSMGADGTFWGTTRFATTATDMIRAVSAVKAKEKRLVLEEGTLSQWVASEVRKFVTEVVIADPRQNRLISEAVDKRDENDTRRLCELLRLGALKRVYHPENDDRALFKAAVQHYLDVRGQQVAQKQKIKATYQHWGVTGLEGQTVYTKKHRAEYVKKVGHESVREQLDQMYQTMDRMEAGERAALQSAVKLGQRYPEIRWFQNIPGIGVVGSHVFDAFVQTPERFSTKQKLWRYCRLGIKERSSDGKPLGFKRLDRSGVGELKAVSYRAWLSGMKCSEVKDFYEHSLKRTGDRVHARLNTQRKILAVMWGMWKRGENYRSEVFLGASH